MPNFTGNVAVASNKISSGSKSIFSLTGDKIYSSFEKAATFRSSRAFTGSKVINLGSGDVIVEVTKTRTVGQLFP